MGDMNGTGKKGTVWFLVLILAIAIFLRTYQLAEVPPGLYPDEAMNGNNALEALRSGDYKLYYPENNGREGLFINIQAFFLKAIGLNEPWVLRLPSAIFGVLTVLGLYFLGRELFSKQAGLVASFLLAASFWHINFSRIGFRAIVAPMLLVWGIFLLLKAIKNSNVKTQISNQAQSLNPKNLDFGFDLKFGFWILPAFLGGLLFGLGFHTYIAYRIMPLLLIVIWYFFRQEENFWKIAAVFLVGAFIAGLPIGLYYLQNPADFFGRTSQISIFSKENPLLELGINIFKTVGMFFWAGDYNWRHNLSGEPQLFLPVGILFIVGMFVAAKDLIQNSKVKSKNHNSKIFNFAFCILISWLILATLPVIISSEGLPHALRSILMLPPVMLFAAAGGVYIYEKLAAAGKIRFAAWSAGILAVILIAQAYISYFLVWANNPNTAGAFSANYVALGRELNSLPPDIPKYVIVQAGGVDVRGIPMPAQTVMFITDTFLPEGRRVKNIHYLPPDRENEIPSGGLRFYIK